MNSIEIEMLKIVVSRMKDGDTKTLNELARMMPEINERLSKNQKERDVLRRLQRLSFQAREKLGLR